MYVSFIFLPSALSILIEFQFLATLTDSICITNKLNDSNMYKLFLQPISKIPHKSQMYRSFKI